MNCYNVEYSTRYGRFTAAKWADDEAGALGAVQSKHADAGLSLSVGMITYRGVSLVDPQPFGGVVCPPPGKLLGVVVPSKDETPELDFGGRIAA